MCHVHFWTTELCQNPLRNFFSRIKCILLSTLFRRKQISNQVMTFYWCKILMLTCSLKTLWTFVYMDITSNLWLQHLICNKDQFTFCCDVFLPSSWLKLYVIFAILLACTWWESLHSFLITIIVGHSPFCWQLMIFSSPTASECVCLRIYASSKML